MLFICKTKAAQDNLKLSLGARSVAMVKRKPEIDSRNPNEKYLVSGPKFQPFFCSPRLLSQNGSFHCDMLQGVTCRILTATCFMAGRFRSLVIKKFFFKVQMLNLCRWRIIFNVHVHIKTNECHFAFKVCFNACNHTCPYAETA